MAVANPWSITYGGLTVGGSTSYQLHGPYVIDKSYDAIRVVFDVIIAAGTFSSLQSLSDALETDFRTRLTDGDTFIIDVGSSTKWTYTVGKTILHLRASLAKTGNPDTDKGYSRAYTVTIEGELPADDTADAGLRDVEVLVDYQPGRQRVVTMRGTYTATSAGDAKARYTSAFDTVATDYLDVVDSSATWELVDETFTMDREQGSSAPATHVLEFTRQYVELLADQSQSTRDDTQIKDHRITFTDLHQYPGDSKPDADRLRRVIGSYDCAVDIEQTTDLQSVYANKVKAHIRELFRSNFQPSNFGVEEERVSYDETGKRISVSLQFIYLASGGEALVEVSQSVAYREARNIDYTPTHEDDEFAAEADVGFAVLERVWSRTAIVVGQESPKLRIRERAGSGGPAGRFSDVIGGLTGPDARDTTQIAPEGWNVIGSTSQVMPQFLGDPNGVDRIEVTVLTESVTERFHSKPGRRTSIPIRGGGGVGSAGGGPGTTGSHG